MSRFDRCRICDYNEEDGTVYGDRAPHRSVKVRRVGDDYLCTECEQAIDDTLVGYDDLEEEVEDDETD